MRNRYVRASVSWGRGVWVRASYKPAFFPLRIDFIISVRGFRHALPCPPRLRDCVPLRTVWGICVCLLWAWRPFSLSLCLALSLAFFLSHLFSGAVRLFPRWVSRRQTTAACLLLVLCLFCFCASGLAHSLPYWAAFLRLLEVRQRPGSGI